MALPEKVWKVALPEVSFLHAPSGAAVLNVVIPAAANGSQRNLLVQQTTLNQLAPFHVVEEERLRVVAVVEFHRTADVEPIGIEAELSNFLRSRIEVVASIKSVIAVEFPCGSVELLAAGLDNFSDGSGGRKAVLSAVVGGHVAEFSDGIERRHNAAAAAAAIKVLAAVNELHGVASALAVDADVAVAADCGRSDEVALKTGSTWRQCEQGVHAASVGGELRDLLSGDDSADFAGIRLNRDRIRFDGNFLRDRADSEGEIETVAIAYVQDDAVFGR